MVIGIDASRANLRQKTGVEWYGYHVIREFGTMDTSNHYRLYTWEPLRDELASLPPNFEEVVVPPKRLWPYTALAAELKHHPVDRLFIPSHLVPRNYPEHTVVCVHDLGFRHFPENYSRWHYLSLTKGTQWSVEWAERVVVPSQAVANDVQRYYETPPTKVVTVPAGYDHRMFDHLKPKDVVETMQKHRIRDPYLLFVGRLESRKNVTRVIEAFYRLRDSGLFGGQLVLVGNPGQGYDEIRDLISKQREKDSIIQPGYLPDDERSALYRGARAFIFPSLFEGFGIPILEAFAAETPVLTSRMGATAEVAGDAALLVDPESVGEIHAGMEQLLGDQALVEGLVERGRERVTHFSWRRTATEIYQLLTA